MQRHLSLFFLVIASASAAVFALPGCAPKNPHETTGFLLPVALQRACISGKVSDAVTGKGIDGVAFDVSPPLPGPPVATNREGFYYAEFPGGSYRLRLVKEGYRSDEQPVIMTAGETIGKDVVLEPTAPVIVDAGQTVTGAGPGTRVTLKAKVTVRDGSRLKEIHWKIRQEDGKAAPSMTEESDTVRITLPDLAEYKRALLYGLRRDGRLYDRWMVTGLTPSDLKEAGRVTLTVTATTTSGAYTDTVDIVADLRSIAAVNPGLQNVAIGTPVFLQGKDQSSYAWALTPPAGSTAAMKDTATRNPTFIPDVPGTYIVREGGKERLTIHAGQWNGLTVAKETDIRSRWIGVNGCICHYSDAIAPQFAAWRTSGHAEIFTQCVNTIFRYEERCFTCHTVGFGGMSPAGGISAAPTYPAFQKNQTLWDHGKTPPIIRPRPDNLDVMIDAYPDVARLTNVQCENCHGPNNTPAHKTLKKSGAPERISLSATACSICHDELIEPSFRQWLDNDHSNYNLAVETATVDKRGEAAGDCGRCHSGQGFLAWVVRGDRQKTLLPSRTGTAREALSELGLTADKVHPLTCAVCHDPHSTGSSFRSAMEKVPVRTANDARMHPTEFRSETGGRGAVCIICHSTIPGPHNDAELPRLTDDAAPHAGQGDVLFGQNAFFTPTGAARSHARIEDTCVWCHVKPVPKPSTRGYPRGEANHSFKSGVGHCARCHKEFDGEELMAATERDLENLKREIEGALAGEIRRKGGIRLVKAAGEGDISLSAADVKKLGLIDREGKLAVEVTTTEDRFKVPLGRVSPGGAPLLASDAGQIIAKAAWNYFLLKNDGSNGAHNPQFTAEVLGSTFAKIGETRR